MKKIYLSIIGSIVLSMGAFAQAQNVWCGTDQLLEQRINGNQSIRDQIHQHMSELASQSHFGLKATKIIPVVVHVLYDTPAGNISEAQIQSALDVLNNDFNRLNADASSTRNTTNAPFAPEAGSMDIQFKLAKLDPNGNCTNGIIRKQVASNITNEVDQSSEPHKFTANGGSSAWPRNEYFNIWLVNSIGVPSGGGIILGYAQFPAAWGGSANTYGLTMRHDYTGTIGTSSSDGRTLTHEVGHCLGLFHTFQGGCGNTGPCNNQGDYCCDTPPQADADYGCPQTLNTCAQIASGDPYGINVYDQIENYMSYNSCTNMFSQDQVNMMEANFTSLSWMSNLASPANAIATGVDLPAILCQADFTSTKTTICAGEQVTFTDASYSAANDWEWTFTGGIPNISSSQNPTITYNTPGTYAVTLTASDGSNDDTETKTAYITVLPDAVSIPLLEGFESYSTLNGVDEWEIINTGGNAFELAASTGLNSSKSARLMNFGQAAGGFDELVSSPVDLSGASQITLSYRYAHKRRNTSDADVLRVYVTNNCGDVWNVRNTRLLSSTSAVQGTSFTPASASDWTTVHMTNITGSYFVDNFRYKFVFEGGGGNNIFIDNINIYEGSPSDDLVDGTAGITELASINGLAVYPNPTDEELTVDFSVHTAQEVIVTVQDVSGKIAQQNVINANEGSNLVLMNTQNLSSGIYFLEVKTGGARQVKQFVVK